MPRAAAKRRVDKEPLALAHATAHGSLTTQQNYNVTGGSSGAFSSPVTCKNFMWDIDFDASSITGANFVNVLATLQLVRNSDITTTPTISIPDGSSPADHVVASSKDLIAYKFFRLYVDSATNTDGKPRYRMCWKGNTKVGRKVDVGHKLVLSYICSVDGTSNGGSLELRGGIQYFTLYGT